MSLRLTLLTALARAVVKPAMRRQTTAGQARRAMELADKVGEA